jgi:hypothetical protein
MVAPVSQIIVEQVLEEIAEMPESDAPGLIDRMQKEQPALLAFLLSLEESGLSTDEFQMVLYEGVLIWKMMKRGNPRLRRVSIKKIEEALDANIKELEDMAKDSEGDFVSAIDELIETYAEPAVFRYMVEALMEGAIDEVDLSEEAIGIGYLHLKTAMDTLVHCRKKHS